MFQSRKIWNGLIALAFATSVLWSGQRFANVLAAPMMNNTAQNIPFYQGWTDTSMINTYNDWGSVPGFVGFRESITTTERDPRLIVSPAPDDTPLKVIPNWSFLDEDTFGYGPVELEFFNPTIGLRGGISYPAPYIQVSLNTTGTTNPLFLYFRARDVDYLSRTAVEKLAVQYRIGNTGNFTNIDAGYIEAATTNVPYDATKVTAMTVPLDIELSNKELVQIRFITADVVGSDQWIGIDDITIDENLPPFVDTVTPADGLMGIMPSSTINLVWSETGVVLTDTWYSLTCGGNPIETTYFQDDRNVTITPTSALPVGALCTLVVDENKTQVQDSTGKGMIQPFSSQFTVSGCGVAATTKISTVQGTGEISPIAGQIVTVEGIVTNFPTFVTGSPVGFYLQSVNDSDGNPASSEGLFVEVPSTMLNFFSLGQHVRLTGTVGEYTSTIAGEMAKMTRLASVDIRSREICATGKSVSPVAVDLSQVNSATYLERYEGMLVSVTGALLSSLTIQQNEYLGRFGQMILGSDGRISNPNNGTGGLAADVNRMIILDDGSTIQYPNPIPFYGANGVNRAGDRVTGVTGILDQGRINSSTSILDADLVFPNVYYRVQKTATPTFTVTGRPNTPPAVNGTLKVASFNVDNYFTTLGSLGATTEGELTRQKDKLVRAIAGIGADVIALQGVEASDTSDAVTSLRNAINDYTGTTNYEVVADPDTGTGTGLTQVALIYNKIKVTPVGSSLSKPDSSFTSYPVAQLFQVNANSQKFIVVGAHFSSTDQAAQASALLSFINTDLKPLDPDVVVAGDLNTYAADGTIAALAAGGLTNQVVANGPTFPYSYVENGAVGYRDYLLTTLAANRQVEKVDFWHINADEPAIIDYNTELKTVDLYVNDVYRSAVHDPVMIGLTIVADQAPVATNPIPNQLATEDISFNYQFPANTFSDPDPDDHVVSYDAKLAGGADLPAWLSFNAATRTFSGMPSNADVGPITIEVRAFDYTGVVDPTVYGTDQFVLTVTNVNDAPTVANPIPDQLATEDALFTFIFASNTFADEDAGDTLTYSAKLSNGSPLPAWLSFNPATRTFSGTPLNENVGTIVVEVKATDTSLAYVSDRFNITVANTNDAPAVVNPIPSQTAIYGKSYTFTFAANTFSDVDSDDTLAYEATLADGSPLPAWLSFDPATRTFSGTPSEADKGTFTVKVTATDSGSVSVSTTFTMLVKQVDFKLFLPTIRR